MKKKVYIIHGWGGTPTVGWFAWLKKELEEKDFEVHVPQMPNPEKPKIESWVSFLGELANDSNEYTYFVGHSMGCQTILRYIGRLSEKTKIGGVVCVSGWFTLKDLENEEDWETARPWLMPKSLWDMSKPVFEQKLDTIRGWLNKCLSCDNLEDHLKDFVAIFSDNDPYVPLEENKRFFETLGAKTIVMPKMNHMSEDDYSEMPIVLEELLKMAK